MLGPEDDAGRSRERLERFEAGSLHIAKVIHDLEGLLEALQITPDAWRDAFGSSGGTLESHTPSQSTGCNQSRM